MPIAGRSRILLRAGALALTVLGVAGLVLGALMPGLTTAADPVPVPPGGPVGVPEVGAFGGEVLLYGRPQQARRPSRAELGCRLEGSGELSASAAAEQDRRVVDGAAVLPLLVLQDAESAIMRCDGAQAVSSQPMYLLVDNGVRDQVPMATLSLSVLMLAVGAAGVSVLRSRA